VISEVKNKLTPLTRVLSRYLVTTTFQDLPDEGIQAAKLTILDSITCMLGGIFTPAGEIVTRVMGKGRGNRESTILGLGHKTDALAASLTNAVLANALDYDDYYPVCHPSATIVPPGMAVSESSGADGKTLLTAVVVANEVYIRVMDSILASNEQQKKIFGFGTHQTFGAAAVAGKILGLDEEQMAHAIGIAGANAPVPASLKTVYGDSVTMVKNNYGIASFVGVLSAKLAQSGFIGPLDIFEGDTGFWRMSGSDQFNPLKMTEGLGSDFRITRISFKPYPCCRWIHSALDGIFQIIKEGNPSPDKIQKIEVRSFSLCTSPPFSNRRPKTFDEASFSTPYLISMAILGVPPGPKWYREDTRQHPDVLALANKVTLIDDEEANSLFPEKLLSKVTLYTAEESFYAHIEFPFGGPERPMKEADLVKKFIQLTEGLFSNDQRDQCLEWIRNLEKKKDLRKLTRLLTFRNV
jgi:2-methylcitrate dehydratase PrpD